MYCYRLWPRGLNRSDSGSFIFRNDAAQSDLRPSYFVGHLEFAACSAGASARSLAFGRWMSIAA